MDFSTETMTVLRRGGDPRPKTAPTGADAARVKVIPHGCVVALRVQPVAHGLHAVIPESRCMHCRLLAKRGHKYRLSVAMATHYHRVTGDTLHTRTGSTAKPGHALARPGHGLVSAYSSVKVRQHAHVTCSLAQALITSPQRHTGGHDSTRQERHIDSTEAPPP